MGLDILSQDTRFVCSLEVGENRFGRFLLGLEHAFDQLRDRTFAFGDLRDFCFRSEDAEGCVEGDLFDGFGFGFG